MICLDEMGPERAKSFPGRRVVRTDPRGARRIRATQEIDYGRRGYGYFFGAFVPATGETLTQPYAGRTTANWVDFLLGRFPRARGGLARSGRHPRLCRAG